MYQYNKTNTGCLYSIKQNPVETTQLASELVFLTVSN